MYLVLVQVNAAGGAPRKIYRPAKKLREQLSQEP
jgi:hypothetical protein